jgi:aspartyl-tRNA(Asn)/glutamyl-tRNA(Gln) amidotransferase subunit A
MKNTLHDIALKLKEGVTTSTEVCSSFLDKIDEMEGTIHAFLAVDREAIMKQAAESDARRNNGDPKSPLDGVPVAVKDNIMVKDQICSCASKILSNVVSPYDATVISKMRDAGVISFGRTNMDEFAMGSSCENSAFAKTANPRDTSRVPGGSSGGSAASVAAGEVPAALGSDTGGSIRQPASFCGVVGLKPTYGRVSRYGLVAFASSLDQIGPLTNTVRDSAMLLDVIAGHDPKDSSSLNEPFANFADSLEDGMDLKGVKIGLPKEYFELDGLDSGVEKVVGESIEKFKDLGAEMVEVSLPHAKYAVASYYVIATAEASANLARFDGIRYGVRSSEASNLIETYLKSRGDGFGDEVKRRILLGTFVLSSGYYDAYYLRAQKARTLIRRDFETVFETCDVILSPTAPTLPFKLGEKTSDPLQMYLADIYTISLNLTGFCGISVPAGTAGVDELPVGVQLMGPALGEKKLLKISHAFETNN